MSGGPRWLHCRALGSEEPLPPRPCSRASSSRRLIAKSPLGLRARRAQCPGNGEPTHVHTAGPGISLSVRLWDVTELFDLSQNKVCAISGRYPFPIDILGLVTVKFQQNYTTEKE